MSSTSTYVYITHRYDRGRHTWWALGGTMSLLLPPNQAPTKGLPRSAALHIYMTTNHFNVIDLSLSLVTPANESGGLCRRSCESISHLHLHLHLHLHVQLHSHSHLHLRLHLHLLLNTIWNQIKWPSCTYLDVSAVLSWIFAVLSCISAVWSLISIIYLSTKICTQKCRFSWTDRV